MDLRCRVDQLIDSNCHLELNSMNAGIVIIVVDSIMDRLFLKCFCTKMVYQYLHTDRQYKKHNVVSTEILCFKQ
jgi:hypothetical protein